jgi:hypothetical protein
MLWRDLGFWIWRDEQMQYGNITMKAKRCKSWFATPENSKKGHSGSHSAELLKLAEQTPSSIHEHAGPIHP